MDAEKVHQLCFCKTQPPSYFGGVHKRAVPYSARRGPRARPQTWRSLFLASRTSLGLACAKAPLGAPGRAGEISSLFEHPEVILALAPYG
jgi:hypothetical protein